MALAGYFQGIPMVSPKAVEKYGDDWKRYPIRTGSLGAPPWPANIRFPRAPWPPARSA
jgi:hypothetical protein